MLLHRQRWSLRTRLGVAAGALALIPIGHLALAFLPLSPVIGVRAARQRGYFLLPKDHSY